MFYGHGIAKTSCGHHARRTTKNAVFAVFPLAGNRRTALLRQLPDVGGKGDVGEGTTHLFEPFEPVGQDCKGGEGLFVRCASADDTVGNYLTMIHIRLHRLSLLLNSIITLQCHFLRQGRCFHSKILAGQFALGLEDSLAGLGYLLLELGHVAGHVVLPLVVVPEFNVVPDSDKGDLVLQTSP